MGWEFAGLREYSNLRFYVTGVTAGTREYNDYSRCVLKYNLTFIFMVGEGLTVLFFC